MIHLLSISQVLEMPPPEWLIEGYQPKDALSCIYGPFGVGKSFVAIDQALCVAAGIPWLGNEVKQGPVVYVAAEGVRGYGKRIQAWSDFNGVEPPGDFWCVGGAVQLLREGDISDLERVIGEMDRKPAQVVIDTFSRCFVGGNENLQQDVGVAVDAMNRLQRISGANVMVIHHTGRNGDHERGSTVLPGALETSACLKRSGKGLVLECTKQKDWEEFKPLGIKLLPFAGSLVLVRGEIDPLSGVIPFHWLMLSRLLPSLEGAGSGFDFLQKSSGETEGKFKSVWKTFAELQLITKAPGKRGPWSITSHGRDRLDLYRKRAWTDEEDAQ